MSEEHRLLLALHLGEGRRQADGGDVPALHLPLLVHEAVATASDEALPLAGACGLIYLGADLLDNVADDELPEAWAGFRPAEISLAATTLLASLPQLALAELDGHAADAAMRDSLGGLLARTLLTMSDGQYDDLRLDGGVPAPARCRAITERKGAAEFELFARAGAVLAGAPPEGVEAYARFGHALGAARQLASDVDDIFCADGPSRDLLGGKATLPVAHALARSDGSSHARLERLLAEARHDPGAHGTVRDALAVAGSLTYCALVVGTYASRAAAALDEAGPSGEAGEILTAMAASAGLVRSGEPA